MVTAPYHPAAQAKLAILRDDGRAVEEAMATVAKSVVVHPAMAGIEEDGVALEGDDGLLPFERLPPNAIGHVETGVAFTRGGALAAAAIQP